jgi:uncharacterized protein (TIGR01627 family)
MKMQDGTSDYHVQPPLVTVVVINWNYAAYVGTAIDSILAQDYPAIEAIIVDNGSTDDSRAVIDRHVGGDPRFRVIRLDTNLGQLGALFHIFDEIHGSFVNILDADDMLMSNYISSHVQAHIAMRQSAAFTSSNIYEMDADGRAISGGYWPFVADQGIRVRELPRIDAVPRLATISDGDYRRLAAATSIIPYAQVGWFWGPGTSNLYRRSALALTRQPERSGAPYFHAADAYLNSFCHALGGSAQIDLTLSAYRVHGANYFALRESVYGIKPGRPEFEPRNEQLKCEAIEFVLRNAQRYVDIIGEERFWSLIDHIALDAGTRKLLGLPYLQKALVDNFASFVEIFGERGLCKGLIPRMSSKHFRAALSDAHGGRIPFRFGIVILRASAKRRFARPPKKAKALRLPPTTAGGKEPLELQHDFGPIAVLSHDPPFFKTGIAYDELVGIASAVGQRYGDIPAGFIIYPTWTIEDRVTALAAAAAAHRERFKNHRLLFICNTQREADLVSLAGQPAILLNKNFTVSETIFRPLPDAAVEFDAIYNARFVPYKRHELTAKIDRVAYLSYAEGSVERRDHQRKLLAAALARNPSHVLLNPLADELPIRLSHREANAAINRAAVGLCLSDVEGANYASMEYMLAGLPVVSTPNHTGREVYFDPDYCLICEPDAVAVRDAVEAIKARKLPRAYIRERTLAKIEPERRRFLTLVDEMIVGLGGKRRFDGQWPFAETSGMVTWNTFDNHLSAFDRVARNTMLARENGIGAVSVGAAELEGIQLQSSELRPIIKAIAARPRCALLMFGCGNDSALWEKVNRDGTTAFIEDDPTWVETARSRLAAANVYLVNYGTRRSDWLSLLNAPDKLDLDLPEAVSSRRWDVILVDGPAGYEDAHPGRMKSIYVASRLVAPGGCVFVHDCDRPVERQFAARYLGSQRLFVEARGRAVLNGYAF